MRTEKHSVPYSSCLSMCACRWWCVWMLLCVSGIGMRAASYSLSDQVQHRVVLLVEGAGGCETPWTEGVKTTDETAPSIANSIAGTAGIGAGYRLAYKHLLFQTGLTLKYAYTINNPRDSISYQEHLIDTDNNLGYNLTEYFYDRRDSIHSMQIQVPVLLGGEWGRFYFLAGVKLSAAVYNPAVRNWSYEGEREYAIFYDVIRTPQDQDPNRLPPMRYNRPLSLDLRLAAEIGGRLNHREEYNGYKAIPNPKTDWYLAAYAEYAVWTTGNFNTLEIGVRLTAQWRIDRRKSCNCTNFDLL